MYEYILQDCSYQITYCILSERILALIPQQQAVKHLTSSLQKNRL